MEVRMSRACLIVLAVAAAVAALAPASALANATVYRSQFDDDPMAPGNDDLVYAADPAVPNDLETWITLANVHFEEQSGEILVAGPGCDQVDPAEVKCTRTNLDDIEVHLSDGVHENRAELELPYRVVVDGGP